MRNDGGLMDQFCFFIWCTIFEEAAIIKTYTLNKQTAGNKVKIYIF